MTHGLLELHTREEDQDMQHWRLVVPDVPNIKKKIMDELYVVPYSGHLGYQKTLKKVQQSFYWPDHTVDVRDFVLGCQVCQMEKSIHKVPTGLL